MVATESYESDGASPAPGRSGEDEFYLDEDGVRVRKPGLERAYLGLDIDSEVGAKYSFTISTAPVAAPAADAATLRSVFASMPAPPPGRGRRPRPV